MKQFDPTNGWSHQDQDQDQRQSQANAQANPQSRTQTDTHGSGAPSAPVQLQQADIYHFSRRGKRLNINEQVDPHQDLTGDQSAETADMILQLFERLDQVDKTKEVLLRLSTSLQTLEELRLKEHTLRAQLQQIQQLQTNLQAQVEQDMSSAQAVEDSNLKIRQYRKELLGKLAGQIAQPGPSSKPVPPT